MELCPREDEKSSDFLAAKLYYKMLSYKFCLEEEDDDDDFEDNKGGSLGKFRDDDDDDDYDY